MFSRTFRILKVNKKAFAALAAGGVGLAAVGMASASADEKPMFVINGFYMQMREAYTAPGKSIHYMTVEWPEDKLAWGDFRGKVLGATDPKSAAKGSARNDIFVQWKELGLASEPNTGDNGVHASASPFEAMAERVNWLGQDVTTDYFGKAMLDAGVPKDTVMAWTVDPQVPFEGGKGSLFDFLEDLDATPCLQKSIKIAGVSQGWGSKPSLSMNKAFVFIKPHAVTDKTKALVKAKFKSHGIAVTSEGSLDSKTIDEKKLIDQHYYSIANKATLSKPKDLNPPAAKTKKFGEMFGISWEKALAEEYVYNASDACAKLGVDGNEMNTLFGAAKKKGDAIKFGGGFYCAKIEPPKKKSGGFFSWIFGSK